MGSEPWYAKDLLPMLLLGRCNGFILLERITSWPPLQKLTFYKTHRNHLYIMSSSSKVIPSVIDFIKTGNNQPAAKPGFGHAVRLSYNMIAKQNLSWKDRSLTYRYTFNENVDKATPGLFMAIMDELTTSACFCVGQPSAPGTSLNMQVELAAGAHNLQPDDMDVVSTVVKLGRKISFTRCEFYQDQKVIAVGSHVMYMPTGSLFLDLVCNKAWAWNLYIWFEGNKLPDQYEEKHLWKGVIRPYLEYHSVGDATFSMNGEHVNPFGGLHVSTTPQLSLLKHLYRN
jgi:hypothetical protein